MPFNQFTNRMRSKRKRLQVYSVKNVPASDGSENRTVAPRRSAEHLLLATPLLLCAQKLCGAGQSPGVLLLQRLGAVDPQRTQLILGLC